MSPFLGQIMAISWNFAPKGWAFCNGQLLPINQNQALFAVLGTTYGGDGIRTFGLPNLQGRIPVGSNGQYPLGSIGGETAVTLTTAQVPPHNHQLSATNGGPTASVPTGNILATAAMYQTSASGLGAMEGAAVTSAGGSQPHTNEQPYIVINYVIALQGIFPSQN